MTEPNRSMHDVQALVDERRRYEAWLAALDSRRDTTPPHVFERVQTDYRNRLQQVAERLASHRQTIVDERASVVSRLSLLEAEEQMRRDERAELELRTHVGELAHDDASSAFGAVDDAIAQLGGEKSSLTGRIEELDALLAERPQTPSEPTAPAAPMAPAAPAEAASQPEKPAAPSRPSTPGGSFDELAFLDAVVGKEAMAEGAEEAAAVHAHPTVEDKAPVEPPAQAPVYEQIVTPDESDAESLLAGLGRGDRKGSDDAPLAANVPANTPIVLRTSGAIEQSKTLKCNECGAMNYPTEWYCERCGAELAAL